MKATLIREFGSLTVVRLTRTDWRVSAGTNADDLLGYIERLHGRRFEIVWMTDPMRWGYAESFEQALIAFGDSARFTGSIFDKRTSVA